MFRAVHRRPPQRLLVGGLAAAALAASAWASGALAPAERVVDVDDTARGMADPAGHAGVPGASQPVGRFAGRWGQLAPGTGEGSVYVVSPEGSDTAAGTAAAPWRTIARAVGAGSPVGPGDVVEVRPGTYVESVSIEVSGSAAEGHVVLRADGEVTVVDPTPEEGFFGEGVLDADGQEYLVVEGFRVEGASWAAIALQDARSVVVRDNTTVDSGASGIIVLPRGQFDGGEAEVTSADVVVTGNRVERAQQDYLGRGTGGDLDQGGQQALALWGVDGCEVSDNTVVEANREGIVVKTGTRNCAVHHNRVTATSLVSGTPAGYRGGGGIVVDGSRARLSAVDVYANEVYDNQASGIAVVDGDARDDVSDVRVFGNVVHGNGQRGVNTAAGLEVGANVRDLVVASNVLTRNVVGLRVDSRAARAGTAAVTGVALMSNLVAQNADAQLVLADVGEVSLTGNVVEADQLPASVDEDRPYDAAGTVVDVVRRSGNVVRTDTGSDWAALRHDPETGAGVRAETTVGPRG